MGVTNSEIPVKLYVYPGNWHLDSYLWMSLGHIQKLLEPKIITKMVVEWVYMCVHGLHVHAWSTCVFVVCMCVWPTCVCTAYVCVWSACVCVVCMCVHGLHVCVVCMCVHGLHVCEIDPFTLFLTVLESDCDTAFTVAHGSPNFPSWK